ncbi:hypothetical protein BKA70DRAFT_561679 [Coprinopsis sp. MPI-PUGE-AT-0042]|nr:hypothetical protein BKA70DRAFT_561679 [Coprinopsis sp. MPI-PUGE-AT-0042]
MSFAPPPETEESRRRRAQSDRASEELGRRLLRGWAMLGEECPSSGCYGVPLMRPPNKGDERSPNKECVICGNIYTTDAAGHLVSTSAPETSAATLPLPSSSRRDTIEQLPTTRSVAPHPDPSKSIHAAAHAPSRGVVSVPLPVLLSETSTSLQFTLGSLSTNLTTLAPSSFQNPEAISRAANAISEVAQALRHVEQLRKDQAP